MTTSADTIHDTAIGRELCCLQHR